MDKDVKITGLQGEMLLDFNFIRQSRESRTPRDYDHIAKRLNGKHRKIPLEASWTPANTEEFYERWFLQMLTDGLL